MNKAELTAAFAESADISRASAEKALNGMMAAISGALAKGDGVVKTLHLLRHCKFNIITTYLSTPHSTKFAFLEYEVFYLAIQKFTFYEFVKGDSVTLAGFGIFSVSKRAARTGRNPQTGKEIKIAAKKIAKFKAGSKLAKAVN